MIGKYGMKFVQGQKESGVHSEVAGDCTQSNPVILRVSRNWDYFHIFLAHLSRKAHKVSL